VMEIRSGGIGTDRTESFIGMPQLAVPGPMPLQVPEIQLMNTKTQTATAKIGIVAYDAKTGASIGDGGVTLARSEDNNWFVFGIGPFNSGNVRNEVADATGRSGMAFELARYIPIMTQEPDQPVMAPVLFSPDAESMPRGFEQPAPQTARGLQPPSGVPWPQPR
jgi:hypothetical protein